MGRKNMIEIDGQKLKKLVLDKRRTLVDVSREIGCSEGYLSVCISTNTISMVAANMLAAKTGITPEDYKPEVKVDPVPGREAPVLYSPEQLQFATIASIDYDRLGKVVYTAVYEAVKKWLAE